MLTTTEIRERALREWVEESGCDPELAEINIECGGTAAQGRDITGWKSFDPGSGFWFSKTIEPITGHLFDRGELRFFDPIQPKGKKGKKGRPIKYATFPQGRSPMVGLLKVPQHLWEKVAVTHGVSLETVKLDHSREDLGFWKWVIDNRLPIVITEGRKKAGVLLTHGYVGVSVNGVWNSTERRHNDERQLVDGLRPFCQNESQIVLAYDADVYEKPGVYDALKALDKALKAANSTMLVSVASWLQEDGKGIDDMIVKRGASYLSKVMGKTQRFDEWEASHILPPSFEVEVIQRIEENGHHFIYSLGRFYKWNGVYWGEQDRESDGHDEVRRVILDQLERHNDPHSPGEVLRNAATPSWMERVLSILKVKRWVQPKKINPPEFFNVLNGYIELHIDEDEGIVVPELHAHDRSGPIFTYCSEFKYNPDADPTHWETVTSALNEPHRTVFLKSIAIAIDMERFRSKHGRNKGLFLLGGGNNGKDSFRIIIEAIFQSRMTNMSLNLFRDAESNGKSHLLQELDFSAINWSSESSQMQLNLQTLKMAITGDPIVIDPKYARKSRTIIPSATFLFNVNKIPIIPAGEENESRYGIIPFPKTFKDEPDPRKPEELKADPRFKYNEHWVKDEVVPAAFNHLIQLYAHALKHGIAYKSISETLTDTQSQFNHLQQWIDDIGLVETKDPLDVVSLANLWDELKAWYQINEYASPNPDGTAVHSIGEQDRYDPIVTSKRHIKKRLEAVSHIRVAKVKRQSVAVGWKIEKSVVGLLAL